MGGYVKIEPDPIAVEKLLGGDRMTARARNADVHVVIGVLAEREYHDGQIALIVGRSRRSVQRTRNNLGIAPAIDRCAGSHIPPVDAPTRPRELR